MVMMVNFVTCVLPKNSKVENKVINKKYPNIFQKENQTTLVESYDDIEKYRHKTFKSLFNISFGIHLNIANKLLSN